MVTGTVSRQRGGGFLKWLVAVLILCWFQPGWADSVEQRLRAQINDQAYETSDDHLSKIWRQLQQLSLPRLLALARSGQNNYYEQGWFELAQIYRSELSERRVLQLERWRDDWFHHPAAILVSRLVQEQPQTLVLPDKVERLGVLLPLSGPLAEQGQAVLEGIRTAQQWDRRQGVELPELVVFDTDALEEPNAQIIRLTRSYSLDMLVGPLQPELSGRLDQPLPIPVLALNRSGGGAFNGYQLDLASDQELRQLIALMHNQGLRRILVLAPADESWVEPLLLWVRQQMQGRDMQLAGLLRYSQSPARLKQQLGRLLGVRASQARADALRALVSDTLVSSPRRRQDLDAVLLIARPEQARLLKPLLAFERAEDLPVYAGSHLYTGTPDALQDRDLDGIRFCDMPWRLRRRQGVETSSVFFALGMDAGSVYRALPQMRAGVPGYFEGETGHLRLDGGTRLIRTLLCARFDRGVPVPYVWSDGRRYP